MTENLLSTIIYGIFSIIVAAISSFATIRSAEISSQAKTRSRKKSHAGVLFQRIIVFITALCIMGAIFFLIRIIGALPSTPSAEYKIVDLGSTVPIDKTLFDENEPIITFVHHPIANIEYSYITLLNAELIKVDKVCGFFNEKTNITFMFPVDKDVQSILDQSKNAGEIQVYKSLGGVRVPEGCSVFFYIQNKLNGFVSIKVISDYTK